MDLAQLLTSFILGLGTPLTALCVIPLYPSFISYLSSQFGEQTTQRTYALFGVLVATGIVSFMAAVGIVFSTIIQTSLTGVVEVISPAAFGILGLMGVAMVLDLDFQRYIPSKNTPEFDNPLLNAYAFGFFFGAIVLPCNPAFIATFLSRAFLFETPVSGIANFTLFGLGMGFPVIAFSLISSSRSQEVISFLKSHRSKIHRGSGAIILVISIYYLVKVFNVLGL